MMFTLHLNTCNLGTEVRKGKDPFTGETAEFPIDPGLSAAERSAVEEFLAELAAEEPDPDSYCRVELADGSMVNVRIGTLRGHDPCVSFAVECSALTREVASFVHELACRANMSVGSTIEPEIGAVPLPGQAKLIIGRWPSVCVVETPARLRAWLRDNIKRGTIS